MSVIAHDFSLLANALAVDIGEAGKVDLIQERIARAAQRMFAADACVVIGVNPETDQLPWLPQSCPAPPEPALDQQSLHPYAALARRLLDHGVSLLENVVARPEYSDVLPDATAQCLLAAVLRTKHQKTPLALLFLRYTYAPHFDPARFELLDMFIEQAASSLQQTWLLFRYAEVATTGKKINQRLDTISSLFRELSENIRHILDTSHWFMLVEYKSEKEALDFHLIEGGVYQLIADQAFTGGSRWVIERQEPLLVRNLSQEKTGLPVQFTNVTDDGPSPESVLFVPLIVGQLCLGVLSIQHPQANFFDEEDLQILSLLGNHVALALHHLHLFDNLRRINTAGQTLTRELDSKKVLDAVVEEIRMTTSADLVVLYPYTESTRCFDAPLISGVARNFANIKREIIRTDDTVVRTVHSTSPVFAADSSQLRTMLMGSAQSSHNPFAQREQIRSTAAIPLRVSDKPVGALLINYRTTQHFDRFQQQLLENMASYAAIAIANAWTFDTIQRRRLRELEALQVIARSINQSLDLEQVLHTMLEYIIDYVDTDSAAVVLHNRRTGTLECRAALGRNADERERWSVPLDSDQSIIRWVFEEGVTARVDNVHAEPWNNWYVQMDRETQSEMDVPILDGDIVIGVINLESTNLNAFDLNSERFVAMLAEQAGLVIKNAQTYGREKRLVREWQALVEISRQISSHLDPKHVFDLILEKALSMTRSDVGTLHLFESQDANLRLVAQKGVTVAGRLERRIKLGEGIVGLVAEQQKIYNVSDVTLPEWQAIHIPDIPNTRSELAVPLLEGGVLRGVLNIEHPQPNYFTQRDADLLDALAALAVVAIQNAERYQQAEARRQRLEAVHAVDQQIIRQLNSSEQVIHTILSQVQQLTGGGDAYLDLEEGDRAYVTYAVQADAPYNGLLVSDPNESVGTARWPIVQHVVSTGKPYLVPGDNDQYVRGRLGIQSAVLVPLLAGSEIFGVLTVESDQPRRFGKDDVQLLELLANQAVIAIQSVRQHKRSERERVEAAQRLREAEAMNSIGTASLSLAHRFGNDLGLITPAVNAIRAELATLGVTTPIIERNLDRIVHDKTRAADWIGRLKEELATMHDNSSSPRSSIAIEVQDLLETITMSYPDIPSTIQVTIAVEAGTHPVRGVHRQLVDTLHNLFANAIQSMPAGGSLSLSARNVDQHVEIRVADTGVGIAPEKLGRVFDLFYSTKGSSGFGLWSARRNALANGGELDVESQLGKGTVFILSLPRAVGVNGGS